MKSPLHILHLEDNSSDASLIQSTLESDGVRCTSNRVQTQREFVAELESGAYDLILSDFSLPAFDGLSALKIVRERWPKLPVILVSGTMGEEYAIDSLQRGATDYVLKERLSRLAPAIRRAMQEVEQKDERERLQAQFLEAQKMEVVGHLAAGVAHDFNNILAVVMGYSELLSRGLKEGDPLRKYLNQIRLALDRAVGLTGQLLVFSRRQAVEQVDLDLNETLLGLSEILHRLIDENIELTIATEPELGCVRADCGQIGQVLMNLVVNARDAMPQGGQLHICTERVQLDEAYAQSYPGVVAGDFVRLSVGDTGTGMTEEVKERLFEAFYTTKPLGKGTGLGLATCRTIVAECGGHIAVASELGVGTTFKIYLPRLASAVPSAACSLPDRAMPRGTETVLVVDDEPAVRQVAREILEAQGYRVLSAANGREALQVAQEHQGPAIRLLVSDLIMPQMGGRVLAAGLQTLDPHLKILFTSGYSADEMTESRPGAKVEFLAKPYEAFALTQKVRALLDTNGTT